MQASQADTKQGPKENASMQECNGYGYGYGNDRGEAADTKVCATTMINRSQRGSSWRCMGNDVRSYVGRID